jgi:serine/threonine-protein kinase RsbT
VTDDPTDDTGETHVPVGREGDIVTARQKGRELAIKTGFTGSDPTVIATAISEVARNIIVYAERGEIVLRITRQAGKRGIVIIARDEGPGIADIKQAMQDGFSTAKSLGLGLPGAKRLMDEFEIASEPGKGTTITMTKWAK